MANLQIIKILPNRVANIYVYVSNNQKNYFTLKKLDTKIYNC